MKQLSTKHIPVIGGVSGFASAVALQPFDLVKTRLQQDNTLVTATNGKRLSIPKVFRKIWVEEGKLALWKGTGATLARYAIIPRRHRLFC